MSPREAPGWRDDTHRGKMQARWVRRGVPVEFAHGVKPRAFHKAPSSRMDQDHWMERKEERNRYLKNGAFAAAESQDVTELLAKGCMICPAFVVPKKGSTNRWRLVVDQRLLNELCKKRGVKFQGLDQLRHVGKKGMWAFTWDLDSGYMNLEMFKPHQKYMIVDMGEYMSADGEPISATNPRFVVCQAMPFGFQNSPWYFVKLTKVIQSALNELGISCLMWVDDGIVLVDTESLGYKQREQLEAVLKKFGMKRQETKDEFWDPAQIVEHLGYGVNLASGLFFVPAKRRTALRRMGIQILCSAKRHRRLIGARWLAQFAGTAISLHLAVSQARFRLRDVFDCLAVAEVWKYGYGQQIRLSPATIRAIQWWIDMLTAPATGPVDLPTSRSTGSPRPGSELPLEHLPDGRSCRSCQNHAPVLPEPCSSTEKSPNENSAARPCNLWFDTTVGPVNPIWRPPVSATVTCDASGEGAEEAPGGGWGATLGGRPLQYARPYHDNGDWVRGIWAVEDQDMHITGKELKAVRYMLEAWRHRLRGRHVLLFEDNQAVVGILRNLVARSPGMRADLLAIIEILEAEYIFLKVRYIKSKNNPSDFYSRVRDKSEWMLDPAIAPSYMHRFGTCQVDRFADSMLALLPRFNASYPCRGAETVDCFSVSWEGTHSWVNPPWNEIGRVLWKLEQEPGASATLLLPCWDAQPWWPALLRMAAVRELVQLPDSAFIPGPLMLTMPGMQPEPLLNSGWQLQLVFVPARTTTANPFSAAMIFGAVQAVASPLR